MKLEKEQKKILTLSILSLLLISIFAGFVSAAGIPEQLRSFGSSTVTIGSDLFGWLFGDKNQGGDEFVLRIFFFLIVFAFVYVILEKAMTSYFDENTWALWLISIAIPAVAVRFLDKAWLYTLLMPQQTLFAAILVIIPFILFFMITMRFNTSYGRRGAWVIFGIVFLMIFISADEKTTNIGRTNLAFVYFYAAIGGIIMAVFDGTFAKYYNKFKASKKMSQHNASLVAHYHDEWNKAKIAFNNAVHNNDPNSYKGRTPDGLGKEGYEAFNKDVKYYTDEITVRGGNI